MQDLYPSRKNEERVLERVDNTVYSKKRVGDYSLNNIELEEYEKNGFIVFPNVFSQDEIQEMASELDFMANNSDLKQNEEFILEPQSKELRTIFNQHLFSVLYEKISKDPRILDKVQQILGSDVYIHHSRINIKPAYNGKSFPWHSDFETWHTEDGLANCRVLSAWIMLNDNTEFNGPLYLIPKSHKKYISCKGETPEDNYKKSLKKQEYGVPSLKAIEKLVNEGGIVGAYGKAGTLVIHDGNVMHGSPDNISPNCRTNIFFVFNSVENKPLKPFGAKTNRAPFLALNNYEPLKSN